MALDEARELGKEAAELVDSPYQWEATLARALAKAQQARGVLERGEAPDALRARVRAVRSGLEEAERGRQLLARLEEIRLEQAEMKGGHFDTRRAVPLYRAAFPRYGLDVLTVAPAEAARRLRGHPLREPLLAALEDWARWTPEKAERERLHQVLRATDADGGVGRDRWREALVRKDPEALRGLAAEAASLPPAVRVVRAGELARAGLAAEAEGLLRAGLRRHPTDFWLNHEMAQTLHKMQPPRLEEAIRHYTAARVLRSRSPGVQVNLGAALQAQGDLKGAVACYHEALRLDPKDAKAHYALGLALKAQGDLKGAAACYREAIRVRPNYAEAHCNLGSVLGLQGRFAESLAAYRRGHALGSRDPTWRYPSAQWVRQARGYAEREPLLDAVRSGQASPAGPGEYLNFARMSQYTGHAAARLYGEAFALWPQLTGNPATGHRYNAACAAARAGCGKGTDTPKDEEEQARLRQQALGWLRADLSASGRLAPTNPAAVRQRLQHWQQDADLAGVRDQDALAKLPADERTAWQKLWAEVEALRQRAQAKP